jgi:hypothetical protein
MEDKFSHSLASHPRLIKNNFSYYFVINSWDSFFLVCLSTITCRDKYKMPDCCLKID